jgi:hypothetical protein
MPFKWGATMGVWFENFALPVVLNECLMQSYTGTIDLYPNWQKVRTLPFKRYGRQEHSLSALL